jgi:uncharacterized membrane protein YbhN (UPF0104 family)
MLTKKRLRLTSSLIFVLVALLILLVWLRIVPESWHWTLLLAAIALILLRITLRLVHDRQERLHQAARQEGDSAPEGQTARKGASTPER